MSERLVLRSDVSNDLKQNADQIGSVGKALAELAWNSVQYQPDGQVAEVAVVIARNRSGGISEIYVDDNGRGMTFADLQRFFTMHAENLDRLEGRAGRGRFGTGAKAAAMAVADEMEVDTVRDGKRIIAILQRERLTPGTPEVEIPFHEALADRPHGTRVTLRRLRIKKFKEESARSYLVRALGRALTTAKVTWNNDRLKYEEPPHLTEWVIDAPEEYAALIGTPKLYLRYSERWLSNEDRGVTITAMDVPHERNFLGDYPAHPLSNRIYGNVEVPLLEEEDAEGRPAYTADRTMLLNRENERVVVLLSWINDMVGDIVKELEAEEKAQQDKARQERLHKTAKSIEEALNRRLHRALERLERAVNLQIKGNAGPSGVDVSKSEIATTAPTGAGENGGQEHVRDDRAPLKYRDAAENERGDLQVVEHEANSLHKGENPAGEGDKEVPAVTDPAGPKGAKARPTSDGKRRAPRPKGSFRVVPKAMGDDAPRAYYAASTMTIYVNTDHPQLKAAGMETTPEFKILMAECAASEFALALTSIRIEHGDAEIDPLQWNTIITAIRREESETGVELVQAITNYRMGI